MSKHLPKLCFRKEIQQPYEALLHAILSHQDTAKRVQALLAGFPERLNLAIAQNEFIDRAAANHIFGQAKALLAVCQAEPRAEFVPYVLAAIDYFLQENDATPDFDDPFDGLNDDAEVIAQVIKTFNLEHKVRAKFGGAA